MKCLVKLNKVFFPEIVSYFREDNKNIYLTFDDGPTPGITSQVLALLSEYNATATFFCRGDQVKKHQNIYYKISTQGHVTGNHGYSHLNGWITNTNKYLDDCEQASELIRNPIFRPPYGKITPSQYKQLKKKYTIYLWTALSWDFHPWVSPERCFTIASKNLQPGSILVFHDSLKASANLLYTLPKLLELGKSRGYKFVTLPF